MECRYTTLILCVHLTLVAGTCTLFDHELVYQWISIEYDWPDTQTRDDYIADGRYIRENNAINGIKIYNGSLFLTIPRLKAGVAASLVEVVPGVGDSPKVRPYPSWNMHVLGDCQTLQLVQSMEVDHNTGYMWILDTAFVPISSEQVAVKCPAKLVIWDMIRQREIMRYTFPVETVGVGMFYLNDLVLDYVAGKVAYVYMSDTLGKKLVVYNVERNISYSVKHESMGADPAYKNITISGSWTVVPLGINGIAMSSDFQYLYYSAVSGVNLYRIKTDILRDSNVDDAAFSLHYEEMGSKGVQSDGMYCDKGRNLYYSTLGKNGVYKWSFDSNHNKRSHSPSVLVSDDRMEWIDSLGMDEQGYLWFTSNNLHTYFGNTTDPGKYNYFVWRVFVDDESYLYEPDAQHNLADACDNSQSRGTHTATPVYEWTTINLQWPTCSMKAEWLSDKRYIRENNIIDNVKVYKGRVFVSIPRLRAGVPVTLAEVIDVGTKSPSLIAYPSWSWHNQSDCDMLQLIHSFEIDPNTGYMWILDTAYAPHGQATYQSTCRPKLIVYDINHNQEIHRHYFPSLISSGVRYFSDIVLDLANSSNIYAYISDTLGSKLVVYDYSNNDSYAFVHPSMDALKEQENITISSHTISVKGQGINGLAISPDFLYVYYCVSAGTNLYQIPTSVLRNPQSSTIDFLNKQRNVGNKGVHTDGILSGQNDLYFTSLERNSIKYWDVQKDFLSSKSYSNISMTTTVTLIHDCRISWTSSITIDDREYMWFATHDVQPFYGNATSLGAYNVRLWKVKINDKSYLDFSEDPVPTTTAASCWTSVMLACGICLTHLSMKVL